MSERTATIEHERRQREQAVEALRESNYDNSITDYWHAHYVSDGLCSLCGNSGVIDTRDVFTAAGVACGRKNWCLCPNGQVLRGGEGGTGPKESAPKPPAVCSKCQGPGVIGRTFVTGAGGMGYSQEWCGCQIGQGFRARNGGKSLDELAAEDEYSKGQS